MFRWIQKRQLENQARAGRGEDPLPEEDINKVFKVNLIDYYVFCTSWKYLKGCSSNL